MAEPPADTPPREGWWLAAVTAASVCAGAFLAVHLGEDATPDLVGYHLADPFWLFANHLRDVEPAGYQSYYNPLLSAPTYLTRHLAPHTAQLLLGALEGLCGPLAFLLARQMGLRRVVAVAVAAAGLVSATPLSEFGTSQGDLLVAVVVLSGLVVMGRGLAGSPRCAVGGAAILGAACGLKWSVVPVAIAAVVCCAVARPHGNRGRAVATAALGAVAGAVVTYGWWGVVLTAKLHDPFFPALTSLFASHDAGVSDHLAVYRASLNPLRAVAFPFVANVNPLSVGPQPFHQYALAALDVVAVGVAIVAWRRRCLTLSPRARWLVATVLIAVPLTSFTSGIYRYGLVLELLAYPALAALVSAVVRSPRVAAAATVTLCAALVATQSPPQWGRAPFTAQYVHANLPRSLRRGDVNVVEISGVNLGFLVTVLPASDLVVRDESGAPLSSPLTALARHELANHRPTYVVWGSPEEGLAPYFVVDPTLATTLHHLGLGGVVVSGCSHVTVAVPGVSYPLNFCPLTTS